MTPAQLALRACAAATMATAVAGGAGCAERPPPATARAAVTLVVVGDDPPRGGVKRELDGASLPFDLRYAELPNAPAPADRRGDLEGALAQARRDYIDGSFAKCLAAIAGDGLVADLLATRERTTAARVLFRRVACHVGAGSTAEAQYAARQLAVFGLELPQEVEGATPDVEATIARTAREVAKLPRVPLQIAADVDHGTVSVDGLASACVTPCAVDVVQGNHVVRLEADGVAPETRTLHVEAPRASLDFHTTPAPPELASQQWTARYAGSPNVDSAASMRLLSRAVRARNLALIGAESGEAQRLKGVLAVDGAVAGRAERSGADVAPSAPALLRELLVEGRVVEPAPRLYERPLFWLTVGVAAAGAATASYFLLRQPEHRTEVAF